MSSIGIVVIGRNEGDRLRRCLASICGRSWPVVYVDSGSTDGSPDLAESLGAILELLNSSLPFNAATARNAGARRLVQVDPSVEFIQFVDGDCEVAEHWIATAAGHLTANPTVAVVCGRRRERHPEVSIYNRLCDWEWNAPAGEVESCGGDSMMRRSAFDQAGGFNPTVAAGEEPELCARLRTLNWRIMRLNAEMTRHDAAITRFGQFWKRQMRGGYGSFDVATRFGLPRYRQQVRSVRFWAVCWPLTVFALPIILGCTSITAGLLCGLALSLALPAQMLRVAASARRRGAAGDVAAALGVLTMLGKWAQLCGQIRAWRELRTGRHTTLIEYKGEPHTPAQRVTAT